MNDYVYSIDKNLEEFLQKDIIFRFNEHIFKRGKLIIFTHGYFSFLFSLNNPKKNNPKKNKHEVLKIPVPFNTSSTSNKIIFDYRIKTLFKNDVIEKLFKDVKKPNLSKFYDKILTIEVI